MDRPGQFLLQRGIYPPMGGNSAQPVERFGAHDHVKMALSAIRRTGMTGVKMGFVHDLQPGGVKGFLQFQTDTICHTQN